MAGGDEAPNCGVSTTVVSSPTVRAWARECHFSNSSPGLHPDCTHRGCGLFFSCTPTRFRNPSPLEYGLNALHELRLLVQRLAYVASSFRLVSRT